MRLLPPSPRPTIGPSSAARLLSRAALPSLPSGISRPSYDVRTLRPGIVHLGVGGFHRAHQAVYLDRLAELDPALGWSVAGVGTRSSAIRDDLLAQECLYTVMERGRDGERARVVGIMRDYLAAAREPDTVLAALADRRTQVITLTVTAPAYTLPPCDDDVFHLLAGALDLRRRRGRGGVTVLSCDNLRRNGDETRARVLAAAAARSDALAGWVAESVSFPNSMVDRITPPPSGEEQRHLRQHYGVHDRVPVATETFSQWVVEDAFAADRPRLEEVGVVLTTDVGPYVDLKTRMLNGAHLALGFLSRATTHTTTAEAIRDRSLRSVIERMLVTEVAPGLSHVPGVDLIDYQRDVLDRLGDPAVADPLSRLRRRGSVRVANYLVPSLERAVAQGRDHEVMLSVLAAWVQHLAAAAAAISDGSRTRREVEADLADPISHQLLPLAARAHRDVRPFLAAVPGLAGLRGDADFTTALQKRLNVQETHTRATAS